MIDSHTHLDLCEPADTELVAEAERAGVRRILTVGTDGASCRAALAAAEAFPQVYAAVGRHPNDATGFDDADLAEVRALAAHPRCVAIGETGLDFYRDYAPRADQERAFDAQIELARETRQAARDPHARRRAGHARHAGRAGAGGERGDALLLDARAPRRVPDAGGTDLLRRQRHLQKRRRPRRGRRGACPPSGCWSRPTPPTSRPSRCAGTPNQPAYVAHTLAFLAGVRGVDVAELGAAVERNAARVFGW